MRGMCFARGLWNSHACLLAKHATRLARDRWGELVSVRSYENYKAQMHMTRFDRTQVWIS